jgi:hypothetical protein
VRTKRLVAGAIHMLAVEVGDAQPSHACQQANSSSINDMEIAQAKHSHVYDLTCYFNITTSMQSSSISSKTEYLSIQPIKGALPVCVISYEYTRNSKRKKNFQKFPNTL